MIKEKKLKAQGEVVKQLERVKEEVSAYCREVCGELEVFYLALEARVMEIIKTTSSHPHTSAF